MSEPAPAPEALLYRERGAILALVAGALCIACAPLFVRYAVAAGVEPTAVAFHRMLAALPLLVLLAWLEQRRDDPPRPEAWNPSRRTAWLMLAGLMFTGDLAVWHWSIHYTTVANATLLANLAPIFVTLAAWLWLGERVTGLFLVGLVMALTGTAQLVRASAVFGGDHLLGDALGITTALFYASYQVTVKQLRRALPTARLMLGVTAFTCLGLLLVCLVRGEPLAIPSLRALGLVVALGWVSQVGGQGLIAYGLAHLPASFSSVTLLVQPVTAALLAWHLFGERLDVWQAMGGVLVLGGILLARRASRSEPGEAEARP